MSAGSRYLAHADAIDHMTLECGAHGYSHAQMAACLGISVTTLRKWAKNHPRFADVLERATTLSQAWWEGRAQDGTANSRIGPSVWHKSVAARFPADYADRQEVGTIGETERKTAIKWKVVKAEEAQD
jgi:hypothetical protein